MRWIHRGWHGPRLRGHGGMQSDHGLPLKRLVTEHWVPIRVLHIVESGVPDAGAVAVAMPGLAESLALEGVSSSVLACDGTYQAFAGASEALSTCDSDTQGVESDAMRIAKYDVLHFHGWSFAKMHSLARAALRAKKPYYISPLGACSPGPFDKRTWVERLSMFGREKKILRHARCILSQNDYEAGLVAQQLPDSTIRVLPYGIRWDDYNGAAHSAPEGLELPSGKILLLLGPIHPAEGLVPLLKAFAEVGLDAEGWSVVVAGRETGDWRRMLDAAIRRKGGVGRIVFVPAEGVMLQRALLRKATVLIVPSLHVRCPVSILQGLAEGVVVIASDRVAPNDCADLVEVCSPERAGFKASLRKVFAMAEEQRRTWIEKASPAGRARLDWMVLGKEYARLYKDVV